MTRRPENTGVHVDTPVNGDANPDAKPVEDGAFPDNGAAPNRLFMPVLVAAIFVSVLASDMVSVVLPTMRQDFGASAGQIGWVVTGYMLSYAIGIPLYGRVSDFFSLRRLFCVALLVFATGGLVCAIAPSLSVLVFGRIVQGAGAAAIPALAAVAVARVLPAGKRGGALGLIGSSVGIGIATGPIAGGVLGQLLGWSFLFWIASVMALVLVPGALRALPDGAPGKERRGERRFDLAGGAFLGLMAGLFLFAVTQGQAAGFASPSSWGSLLGAVLAAVGFALRTFGAAQPFVPPSLFENRAYVAAGFVAFFASLTNLAALVFVPLLVVEANGLSPVVAGLLLTPGGVAVAIFSPLAGRVSDRIGAKTPIIAGLVAMGLSTLFISTFAAGASPVLVSAGVLGVGTGFAFAYSPLNNAAAGALPDKQVGVGLGIFQGLFFLGGGTGPTVVGALLAAREESGSEAINPLYTLTAAPFSDAFLVMTVAVLIALVAAFGLNSGRQVDAM